MTLKIEELIFNFIQSHPQLREQIVLTNFFHADWEADLLMIDAQGLSHEIEIKLSRSDFKNDFKKCYVHPHTGQRFHKHDKILSGDYVCNQFSFLLPMGMVAPEDVPAHCGIIEFYHDPDAWKTSFFQRRQPMMIHQDSYWSLVDKDLFLRKLSQALLYKKFELKSRTAELILKSEFAPDSRGF